MKRRLALLLAIVFIMTAVSGTVPVSAGTSPIRSVLTLNVQATTSSITVSGTTENILAAVVIQVLDSENSIIGMESFSVISNTFSGTITQLTLAVGAEYTVRAADYDGGAFFSKTFSVTAPVVPNPTPSNPVVVLPAQPESPVTPNPITSPEPQLVFEATGTDKDQPNTKSASLTTEGTLVVEGDKAVIETGIGTAQINAIKEAVANAANTNTDNEGTNVSLEIKFVLPEKDIINQLKDDMLKNISTSVTIPSDFKKQTGADLAGIILPSSIIKSANANAKDINVVVKNVEGDIQYEWRFTADELSKAKKNLDVNLQLEIVSIADKQPERIPKDLSHLFKGKDGLIVDFKHIGVLPGTAAVKINVSEQNLNSGDIVHMYYVNKETGGMDVLPNASYVVSPDLFITPNITHCSDYFISKEKLATAVPIKEQVSAAAAFTLYIDGAIGKTGSAKPLAPATLVLTAKKGQNKDTAKEELVVTYRSSKKSVAKVSKYGNVTAVAEGTANITATVTFADGTVKKYVTKVTVEKAGIYIMTKKQYNKTGIAAQPAELQMTSGKKVTLIAIVKGYDPDMIIWKTVKRGIAVVKKHAGKTEVRVVAKSVGTDTLYLRYNGEKLIEVSIKVK